MGKLVVFLVAVIVVLIILISIKNENEKFEKGQNKSSLEPPFTFPTDAMTLAEPKTLGQQPILVDILWQGSIQLGRRNVIELPDETVLIIDDQTSPAMDHQVHPYEPKTRLYFEITHQKSATAASMVATEVSMAATKVLMAAAEVSTVATEVSTDAKEVSMAAKEVSTETPPTDTNTVKRQPRTKIGDGWSSTHGPKKYVGYRCWATIRPNERNVVALTDDTRLVIDGRLSYDQIHSENPRKWLFVEITRKIGVDPQFMKLVNNTEGRTENNSTGKQAARVP